MKIKPKQEEEAAAAETMMLKKRKKKGRPSLLDIQKRNLNRPSDRPHSPELHDDDDDERKQKKVKLVVRLPHSDQLPNSPTISSHTQVI